MKPPLISHSKLRDDLPRYPPLDQALRVTGGTIAGPSGYGSSSFPGPVLYLACTQQTQGTLVPRDREPCLVLDLNRFGLAPGYYTGRLCQSYNGLPVYEVGGSGGAVSLVLAGLTTTQISNLTLSLSTAQINVLNNLTPCQIQTFLTMTVPQQQILTSTLTATQLTTLINYLTSTQLTNLISTLNIPQLQLITNTLNPQQIQELVQVLTSTQISTLLNTLTTAQLLTLTTLSPAEILYVVTNYTTAQLQTFLNSTPLSNPIPATPASYVPTWVAVVKTFSQLSDPSASHTFDLYTLPIKGVIEAAIIQHQTSFTGGGLSSYTVQVQSPSSVPLTSTYNAFTSPVSSTFAISPGTSDNLIPTCYDSTSTSIIKLLVQTAGANINQATAGQLTVWLKIATLP